MEVKPESSIFGRLPGFDTRVLNYWPVPVFPSDARMLSPICNRFE